MSSKEKETRMGTRCPIIFGASHDQAAGIPIESHYAYTVVYFILVCARFQGSMTMADPISTSSLALLCFSSYQHSRSTKQPSSHSLYTTDTRRKPRGFGRGYRVRGLSLNYCSWLPAVGQVSPKISGTQAIYLRMMRISVDG